MKTTMMAGVCLLALVLTFTIAKSELSREKRQASCNELLKNCITACERVAAAGGSDAVLDQCKENCKTAYMCSGGNDDGSDDGNDDGSDDGNDDGSDDGNNGNGSDGGNDDEGSGATAIAGATIFSTISALLVAVASAMN